LFKTMYEQSYFEARLKGSRAQTKTICKKVASLESNWQPGSDRSPSFMVTVRSAVKVEEEVGVERSVCGASISESFVFLEMSNNTN
jgi:hypothetical protein